MKITTHHADGRTTSVQSARQYGDWTKERIALLKRLWKTSAPSSEIAIAINALPGAPLTKNACCGKANRLGLAAKPSGLSIASAAGWKTRRANGTDTWKWRK